MLFNVIQKTIHGNTIASENPKLDAMKQAAYIKNVLRKNVTITGHICDCITVEADGLMPMTFTYDEDLNLHINQS